MQQRFKMGKTAPAALQAMAALDAYVGQSGIEPRWQELIRIRASQINGCAYCVNLHSNDARKAGETAQRIVLVSAWREAGAVFTAEERLLLAMTEEITLIHRHGFSDALYEQAIAVFGEEKTARIIMVIITANAWNRIGVSLRMQPVPVK